MDLSELNFISLNSSTNCNSFDCDDLPINEFIYSEAQDFQKEFMGNSYLFISDEGIVRAFFTISNDSVKDLGTKRNWFNRFNNIPNAKRIKAYPAIKIGRFGVHKDQHGSGLSYQLMDFIKGWVVKDHKPAVRFLILDAYNREKQIKFYTRNGFDIIPIENDGHEDTVFMFYDLMKLK